MVSWCLGRRIEKATFEPLIWLPADYVRDNCDQIPTVYRCPELSARKWGAIESGPVWTMGQSIPAENTLY